jgi:hypothetical protein
MAKVQQLTFLKVHTNDEPGVLLRIMEALKAKNISLKSLWGFGKQDGSAEIYFIGKAPEKIEQALQTNEMVIEKGAAFFTQGTDKAGALLKALETLSDAKINIKGIHAIAVGGKFGSLIWVNDSDVPKAAKALNAQ